MYLYFLIFSFFDWNYNLTDIFFLRLKMNTLFFFLCFVSKYSQLGTPSNFFFSVHLPNKRKMHNFPKSGGQLFSLSFKFFCLETNDQLLLNSDHSLCWVLLSSTSHSTSHFFFSLFIFYVADISEKIWLYLINGVRL